MNYLSGCSKGELIGVLSKLNVQIKADLQRTTDLAGNPLLRELAKPEFFSIFVSLLRDEDGFIRVLSFKLIHASVPFFQANSVDIYVLVQQLVFSVFSHMYIRTCLAIQPNPHSPLHLAISAWMIDKLVALCKCACIQH
jgi:hypothetical protein